jgi:hypothetical protein
MSHDIRTVPHGVELTFPQCFFGLVIKENQVILNIMSGTYRLIILNLNMSFIHSDGRRGISTLLIKVIQVHEVLFKIGCVR